MEAMEQLKQDMARLKLYFPYRIVWGAINPATNELVSAASITKRQANDYVRKGWSVYVAG